MFLKSRSVTKRAWARISLPTGIFLEKSWKGPLRPPEKSFSRSEPGRESSPGNFSPLPAASYTAWKSTGGLSLFFPTFHFSTQTVFNSSGATPWRRISLISPAPVKVVANIPYNITTPLLWKLLETLPSAGYFLLMVQKEAAERMTASPSTKERYPLGVTLELMGNARKVLNVPPTAFRPVPAVHSCLLEITLGKEHRELATDAFWRGMLRSGLKPGEVGKKLLKNLKAFRNEVPWAEVFADLGIGENSRAEELSGEQWLALHRKAKK